MWYPEGQERSLSMLFNHDTMEACLCAGSRGIYGKLVSPLQVCCCSWYSWCGFHYRGVDLYEGASGLATPGTVQATPTVDPTMATLQKEQLILQNDKLKSDNAWAWLSPVSTLFGPLATVGTILVGILVARNNFLQWSKNREDEQKRQEDDQRIEREKRDEERFQSVVEGLSSEREEAKVGAAIMLRTFLRPGYEQFYTQAFDLAVANLRLPRNSQPPEDPDDLLSLPTLTQALIVVFKEAFPLARDSTSSCKEGAVVSLDASGVRLDNAYLPGADLGRVYMRKSNLREVDLRMADLHMADLCEAMFPEAFLIEADLRMATLLGADLRMAILTGAKLSNTDLGGADLREADLRMANPEDASSLENTDLRGVTGLTKEQLAACKAKGAIIDGDSPTGSSQSTVTPPLPLQSNNGQAPSAPPAQVNTPTLGTDVSSAPSSERGPRRE
jgi:uncharacterized protein YjbI with pentapeptide repeats